MLLILCMPYIEELTIFDKKIYNPSRLYKIWARLLSYWIFLIIQLFSCTKKSSLAMKFSHFVAHFIFMSVWTFYFFGGSLPLIWLYLYIFVMLPLNHFNRLKKVLRNQRHWNSGTFGRFHLKFSHTSSLNSLLQIWDIFIF